MTERETPRIVEKANCITVCIGNAVVGSFAGPDCDEHAAIFCAALAQPVAAEPEMWRHKKSGGVYEFLMSVVNEADQDIHVVYRSVETCVRWSRRSIEFYDGRFERLPPTPA